MKLEIERNIASPQEEEEEEFEPVMNGMAMDSVGFENIENERERRPVTDPRCDEEALGDLEGKIFYTIQPTHFPWILKYPLYILLMLFTYNNFRNWCVLCQG